MYFKFSRTRDVKEPIRSNPGDAGIDLFVPNDFPTTALEHGQSVKIPAGIKIEVPIGYAMLVNNKSGVASKKNLDVMANTIDHAYAGEIHINVINNGNVPQTICPGEKLVQLITHVVALPTLLEVPESNLYQDIHVAGSRGTGGFGSTDAVGAR